LLFKKRDAIRCELEKSGFVVEGDAMALVLIVPYSTDEQKAALETLFRAQNVEFIQCPRATRSNKRAISVEIKRM